jgi:hypothetical protein
MSAVLGYRRCIQVGCENYLLEEVAYATAGLCSACWLSLPSEDRKMVEIKLERQTARLSTHVKRTTHNRLREERRKRDPGYQHKKGQIVQAKRAAARRLAVKYRAEYLELLAQERGRRGLDPWPAILALEYAKLRDTTISSAETYAADDAQAEDLDAATGPREGPA